MPSSMATTQQHNIGPLFPRVPSHRIPTGTQAADKKLQQLLQCFIHMLLLCSCSSSCCLLLLPSKPLCPLLTPPSIMCITPASGGHGQRTEIPALGISIATCQTFMTHDAGQ
ncbi:hypothetical protein JOB18_032865 [Solea senegalensis]|uniref:Uncharacterized protein n=1 Tax=Solea senegalensis TaxID=28829 RepID=A0AAV6QV26_SOLSE|nr:hypothetical protein JOB18_032865 [Solea senegalensis]